MVPGQNQQHLQSSVNINSRGHKNSACTNHTELQESRDQAVGKHGGGRYRSSTQNNQGSYSFISEAAFDGQGCRGGGPP